jgi:hypothetical protein
MGGAFSLELSEYSDFSCRPPFRESTERDMRRRFISLLLIPLVLLAQAMGGAHSHDRTGGHEHGAGDLPHFHLRLLGFWPTLHHAHAQGDHRPSHHDDRAPTAVSPDTPPSDDEDGHDDDAVSCDAVQATARPSGPGGEVVTSPTSWLPVGLPDALLLPTGGDRGPRSFLVHLAGPPHRPLFLLLLNLRI